MKKTSFKEYAAEESEKILNGERLLAPEQVMKRLTITRRQLQELHRGENPKGLFLPAYRLADVLRVEWQAMQGGGDE